MPDPLLAEERPREVRQAGVLIDPDGDEAEAARGAVEAPEERGDLAHAVDDVGAEDQVGGLRLDCRLGAGDDRDVL